MAISSRSSTSSLPDDKKDGNQGRRSYSAPTLVRYGSVSKLTATGKGSKTDFLLAMYTS